MRSKKPERGVAALRRVEGDTAPREKIRCDEERMFWIGIKWVEFIKCMRGAGVSIEILVEYVALFQKGRESVQARKELLMEQRRQIQERIEELQAALMRLDRKLDGYEERMLKFEENLYHSPD